LLRRARNRIDAAMTRLVGSIDRDGSFEDAGSPNATAWLIAEGESPAAARGMVGTARALRGMPATAEAFSQGDLDLPRVGVLAGVGEIEPDTFTRDEVMLVDTIGGLGMSDTRKALDYWAQAAAPDHTETVETATRRLRRLSVSPTWAGMVRIGGQCDKASGETIITALNALVDPTLLDQTDVRSVPQRRLDALVDLCRDHLDHGDRPVQGGTKPHITLLVTPTALQGNPGAPCELTETGVITPRTARTITCDATVTELTITTGGTILDAGRARRTIPPAIRTALEARDRGCVIPGCGRPPRWCDAHHIIHWANNGTTTLSNLILLCRLHHTAIHNGQITLPKRE